MRSGLIDDVETEHNTHRCPWCPESPHAARLRNQLGPYNTRSGTVLGSNWQSVVAEILPHMTVQLNVDLYAISVSDRCLAKARDVVLE